MNGAPGERLTDMPPSDKLVVVVLAHDTPLTPQELREESRLADRTLRAALSRLSEAGLVERRVPVDGIPERTYGLSQDGEIAVHEAQVAPSPE